MNDLLDIISAKIADAVVAKITELPTAAKPGGTSPDKTYLTKTEVALRLGISEGTVGVWMRNGKLPFIRRGHVVLFKAEDVEEVFSGNNQK